MVNRSPLALFPCCPVLPVTSLEENVGVDEVIAEGMYSGIGGRRVKTAALGGREVTCWCQVSVAADGVLLPVLAAPENALQGLRPGDELGASVA